MGKGIRMGERVRISDLRHPAFGRSGTYVRRIGQTLLIRFCAFNDVAQAWTFTGCIVVLRDQVSVP